PQGIAIEADRAGSGGCRPRGPPRIVAWAGGARGSMAGGLRPARVRLTVTTAAGRAGIRRQAFSQPPDARLDGVPPRPDAIQEPARPSGVPPRSAGPAPGRGRERCEYGVHGIALLSSADPAGTVPSGTRG